jgi:HK97 family phage major capsid protein
MFAATVSGDPGSAGDLVVPDFQPGITPSATAPLTVADLFAPATTNSNLITYMKETSFVNAADTVAEGTTKPESGITFDAVSDPVRKIAHWLPVTDEMLEDVPQLRGYIDARLRLGVQLELDDQLLNGTTDAPDIIGIRNRSGLGPDIVKGSDTEADAILKAIAQVETTTGLVVSGIVLNATDWHKIQLTKTTTGDYYGSGPFAAPAPLSLWGKPVAISPSMPAGTGLVGAFKTAAVLFFKGGIKVEASNSHQDYFIKNLTALRSEIRCALAVMVPAAFAEITGL